MSKENRLTTSRTRVTINMSTGTGECAESIPVASETASSSAAGAAADSSDSDTEGSTTSDEDEEIVANSDDETGKHTRRGAQLEEMKAESPWSVSAARSSASSPLAHALVTFAVDVRDTRPAFHITASDPSAQITIEAKGVTLLPCSTGSPRSLITGLTAVEVNRCWFEAAQAAEQSGSVQVTASHGEILCDVGRGIRRTLHGASHRRVRVGRCAKRGGHDAAAAAASVASATAPRAAKAAEPNHTENAPRHIPQGRYKKLFLPTTMPSSGLAACGDADSGSETSHSDTTSASSSALCLVPPPSSHNRFLHDGKRESRGAYMRNRPASPTRWSHDRFEQVRTPPPLESHTRKGARKGKQIYTRAHGAHASLAQLTSPALASSASASAAAERTSQPRRLRPPISAGRTFPPSPPAPTSATGNAMPRQTERKSSHFNSASRGVASPPPPPEPVHSENPARPTRKPQPRALRSGAKPFVSMEDNTVGVKLPHLQLAPPNIFLSSAQLASSPLASMHAQLEQASIHGSHLATLLTPKADIVRTPHTGALHTPQSLVSSAGDPPPPLQLEAQATQISSQSSQGGMLHPYFSTALYQASPASTASIAPSQQEYAQTLAQQQQQQQQQQQNILQQFVMQQPPQQQGMQQSHAEQLSRGASSSLHHPPLSFLGRGASSSDVRVADFRSSSFALPVAAAPAAAEIHGAPFGVSHLYDASPSPYGNSQSFVEPSLSFGPSVMRTNDPGLNRPAMNLSAIAEYNSRMQREAEEDMRRMSMGQSPPFAMRALAQMTHGQQQQQQQTQMLAQQTSQPQQLLQPPQQQHQQPPHQVQFSTLQQRFRPF